MGRDLCCRAALGIALLGLAACQHSPEDRLAAEHASTLRHFCLDCHDDLDQVGNLTLEGPGLAHAAVDAEVWEKVSAPSAAA